MKTSRVPLPVLALISLAVIGLSAWMPRADNVSFHPASALEVEKSFKITGLIEIGDLSVSFQGNDVSDQVPGDAAVEFDVALTVTEQFLESAEGRPIELLRTYDGIEGSYETSGGGESDGGSLEDIDALEDKTVRIYWNEETEEYEVSYHESDGDEDLLKAIGDDMDFRSLLPDGEVEEGDSWTVSPEHLGQALLFGTQLADPSLEAGDAELQALIAEVRPQLEQIGEELLITADYTGKRTVDGAEVGVIAISVAGEGTLDLVNAIESLIATQMPDGMDVEISINEATLDVTVSGTGELLWNLAAGHFHSMEMSSEMELIISVDLEGEAGGQAFPVEAEIELLGEIDWSAAAKDAE